jgi:hypothetical protein
MRETLKHQAIPIVYVPGNCFGEGDPFSHATLDLFELTISIRNDPYYTHLIACCRANWATCRALFDT